MRVLAAIAITCACGPQHGGSAPRPPPEIAEFSALRFVPDRPTYLVTARSVRAAQRSLVDVVESFGMVVGVTSSEVSHELERLLAVDPLSPEGAAKLGVDLDGGLAMFSEATDPTFVVHLSAPETTQAFFDHLRDTGLRTQSVIVDGTEINTAKLIAEVTVSWSIEKDWLWVHFGFGLDKDVANTWLAHGRHPLGTGWRAGFGWAKQLGASHASGLVGFFDSHALLAALLDKAAAPVLACAAQFEPVGRVGFVIEGDGHHAGGKLALDLGAAARNIATAIRPPPPGFAALAKTAPLAAQWNLDLGFVMQWAQPCIRVFGIDGDLGKYGIRAGRAALATLDPDDKSGTGVVALDLTSKAYLAQLLDEIPHRSMFESDRTYGAVAGHRLKVPFVVTLDYALDDRVALAAMGDGLLDQLVMGAAPASAPIFALDVLPQGMSAAAWTWLISLRSNRNFAQAVTERLVRWHDGHILVSIDHDTLVIDANGNRR